MCVQTLLDSDWHALLPCQRFGTVKVPPADLQSVSTTIQREWGGGSASASCTLLALSGVGCVSYVLVSHSAQVEIDMAFQRVGMAGDTLIPIWICTP